ncbi:hypothetical protein [Natronoglycomyces albus]|uniref:Uncharacterized protein n=1 Tax=Natronoglycomyces albus TaxID=2811108 RepID=A0A895XS60_9ACTN|nr:hypothetical protein [Natronoglycomyces albus]QSB06045.1 hypothetical protein JQS30_03730 [Natronoglycomyces albus]
MWLAIVESLIRPGKAAQAALDRFEADYARSSALNQIGLCSAYFLAGDIDAALSIGEQIPAEVNGITSHRLRDRVTSLTRDAVKHQSKRAVEQFSHEMKAVGS